MSPLDLTLALIALAVGVYALYFAYYKLAPRDVALAARETSLESRVAALESKKTSLVDLAEFSGLHKDLIEMYKDDIVNDVSPAMIKRINGAWAALSVQDQATYKTTAKDMAHQLATTNTPFALPGMGGIPVAKPVAKPMVMPIPTTKPMTATMPLPTPAPFVRPVTPVTAPMPKPMPVSSAPVSMKTSAPAMGPTTLAH